MPLGMAAALHDGCAGVIQRVTLGDDGRILRLGTEERVFNRHQRRAIALRDGGCIIPGCGVPAGWCEIHHVLEHVNGGPTHTRRWRAALLAPPQIHRLHRLEDPDESRSARSASTGLVRCDPAMAPRHEFQDETPGCRPPALISPTARFVSLRSLTTGVGARNDRGRVRAAARSCRRGVHRRGIRRASRASDSGNVRAMGTSRDPDAASSMRCARTLSR